MNSSSIQLTYEFMHFQVLLLTHIKRILNDRNQIQIELSLNVRPPTQMKQFTGHSPGLMQKDLVNDAFALWLRISKATLRMSWTFGVSLSFRPRPRSRQLFL